MSVSLLTMIRDLVKLFKSLRLEVNVDIESSDKEAEDLKIPCRNLVRFIELVLGEHVKLSVPFVVALIPYAKRVEFNLWCDPNVIIRTVVHTREDVDTRQVVLDSVWDPIMVSFGITAQRLVGAARKESLSVFIYDEGSPFEDFGTAVAGLRSVASLFTSILLGHRLEMEKESGEVYVHLAGFEVTVDYKYNVLENPLVMEVRRVLAMFNAVRSLFLLPQ